MADLNRLASGITRGIVPSCPVVVDWNHPLARGLIACYIPGLGLMDLTGTGPRLLVGSGSAYAPSTYGPAMKCAAASCGMYSTSIPAAWQLATAGSLFYAADFIGAPTVGNALYIGLLANSTNASPYYDYVLWGDFSNNKCTSFGYSVGTTLTSVQATANSWITTGRHSLAASFIVGGAISVYQDGASVASGTWSGGAPTYGTPEFGLGGDFLGNPSRIVNATIAAGLMYNRSLTAAEQMALNFDPFCMLRAAPALITGAPAAALALPISAFLPQAQIQIWDH